MNSLQQFLTHFSLKLANPAAFKTQAEFLTALCVNEFSQLAVKAPFPKKLLAQGKAETDLLLQIKDLLDVSVADPSLEFGDSHVIKFVLSNFAFEDGENYFGLEYRPMDVFSRQKLEHFKNKLLVVRKGIPVRRRTFLLDPQYAMLIDSKKTTIEGVFAFLSKEIEKERYVFRPVANEANQGQLEDLE